MTTHATSSNSRPVRMPLAFRILCHFSGADYHRLASCPLGDKQFAGRIGLQLIVSSAFLFTIFASSLLIGFGENATSDAIVIAMAFVTAAVVLLVDIQIVQSDFHQHGLELARDRGLDDGNIIWAKIRRPATVVLRLALSMTIAFAFATFFELRLFGADILRQIESNYRSANAALFQDVQASYDANLRRLESQITQDNSALGTMNHQEAELRAKLFGPGESDSDIDALLQTVARLTSAKQIADAEALRRNGDAVNELYGVRETSDQSGDRGDGPRHKVAVNRAQLAEQESARLAKEIAGTQAQITELRARRARELQRSSTELGAALQRLNGDAVAVRSRRDTLIEKREQLVSSREAAVVTIAQSRPEYVPRTEGFLARVEALDTLKNRPAVARITFWTTLVIMAVEISAVLSKVFFSVPTLYSVRTALDFEEAVTAMVRTKRPPEQDAVADSIRKDIEIEELRAEFLAKRASRLSKEAALSELYCNGPESNRSAS